MMNLNLYCSEKYDKKIGSTRTLKSTGSVLLFTFKFVIEVTRLSGSQIVVTNWGSKDAPCKRKFGTEKRFSTKVHFTAHFAARSQIFSHLRPPTHQQKLLSLNMLFFFNIFQHALFFFNMLFIYSTCLSFSASVSTCWIQHDHFSTCFFIHWTCFFFLQQFQHAGFITTIFQHAFFVYSFNMPFVSAAIWTCWIQHLLFSTCVFILPHEVEHAGCRSTFFNMLVFIPTYCGEFQHVLQIMSTCFVLTHIFGISLFEFQHVCQCWHVKTRIGKVCW